MKSDTYYVFCLGIFILFGLILFGVFGIVRDWIGTTVMDRGVIMNSGQILDILAYKFGEVSIDTVRQRSNFKTFMDYRVWFWDPRTKHFPDKRKMRSFVSTESLEDALNKALDWAMTEFRGNHD